MSRKTIQKNLSYDDQRRLYYVTHYAGGRRTQTFHTYEAALSSLYPLSLPAVPNAQLPGSSATFGQWLNWWVSQDAPPSRAVSTVYGYQNMARCHMLPALGGILLEALTSFQLQSYLYSRLESGLSANTVLKHYHMLYTSLRRAKELGLRSDNPMEQVIPPKRSDPRHTFYSPEQLRILFRVTEGTTLELAVKLAAYLGLRRSEITGLRWRCVDRDAKIILIQEVRTEVGGREVVKLPKTRRSIRRLGISGTPELIAALDRAWEARQSDNPDEYVLLNSDGTPPLPDSLTYQLAQVVRRCNLPKITLHGLRHSFASIANSQRVPMHDISRTLGHSSIAVTSNIYTHLFDDTESGTVQVVAEAIRGNS